LVKFDSGGGLGIAQQRQTARFVPRIRFAPSAARDMERFGALVRFVPGQP
jgi:hypothetical protein